MSERDHDVLIVEDDYAFRWALARHCQNNGIEADIAENGKEALQLIARNASRYCSVVLDLSMPGASGADILKAIPPDAKPAVIVVTAYDELARQLAAHPRADLIRRTFVKPVDIGAVTGEIDRQCPRRHV